MKTARRVHVCLTCRDMWHIALFLIPACWPRAAIKEMRAVIVASRHHPSVALLLLRPLPPHTSPPHPRRATNRDIRAGTCDIFSPPHPSSLTIPQSSPVMRPETLCLSPVLSPTFYIIPPHALPHSLLRVSKLCDGHLVAE